VAKQRGGTQTRDRKRGPRGKGAPGGRFKPCPFCREKIDVVADTVQFLGARGDGEGGGAGYIPADASATPAGDFPTSPTDDDIPF